MASVAVRFAVNIRESAEERASCKANNNQEFSSNAENLLLAHI